jgi:hypothetical protein
MTYDIYLEGLLLAQDLQPATIADLCKLAACDLALAVEEHGLCTVIDDSGRALALVAHGDDLKSREG